MPFHLNVAYLLCVVCCAGTSVLLVLDWRTEVFDDELPTLACPFILM